MTQKLRYWLFKRGNNYYAEDSTTGEQKSLKTSDKKEAQRIRDAKNEAAQTPMLGMTLAKAYLTAYDPKLVERTWSMVMEEYIGRSGKDSTRARRQRALRAKPFNLIRQKKIVETTGDDFRGILGASGVYANDTLRCLHNLALGIGWLPCALIPAKLWPQCETRDKRGITLSEHQQIITTEKNQERHIQRLRRAAIVLVTTKQLLSRKGQRPMLMPREPGDFCLIAAMATTLSPHHNLAML